MVLFDKKVTVSLQQTEKLMDEVVCFAVGKDRWREMYRVACVAADEELMEEVRRVAGVDM